MPCPAASPGTATATAHGQSVPPCSYQSDLLAVLRGQTAPALCLARSRAPTTRIPLCQSTERWHWGQEFAEP